jgi:hypothetical protein
MVVTGVLGRSASVLRLLSRLLRASSIDVEARPTPLDPPATPAAPRRLPCSADQRGPRHDRIPRDRSSGRAQGGRPPWRRGAHPHQARFRSGARSDASVRLPAVLDRRRGQKRRARSVRAAVSPGSGALAPSVRATGAQVQDDGWASASSSDAQPDHRLVRRRLAHALKTSSSSRCLTVVSSRERCIWLVRVV